MFATVLIANRGEIACRVIRTCRALGIRAVAVYSDADVGAPHVRLADDARRLGPAAPAESYLSIERVLDAARAAGAEAIHPGYGFLSENPRFAQACAEAGIAFVGPPADAMRALGDKVSAKAIAESVGVPVLPGLQRPGLTDEEITEFAAGADRLPLMVKAAAGGGGRGMRIVATLAELPDALRAARREALAGFGDDTLFAERYLPRARHLEVQLLADTHGAVVHLGERECSLQRRHQKLVEESPSPVVTPELRERIGEAACALARAAGYVGAGTAEFLADYDDPDRISFLELNARLQVEHPVTELVTGLDLVEQQLRIAAGEPLSFGQADVRLSGHAIEVRVTAEDAGAGFLPQTGEVVRYAEPRGEGVRVDSGVAAGSVITADYDSLLLKLIASGPDRDVALARLRGALTRLRLLGVRTNAGYLHRLLGAAPVRAGELDTRLVERIEIPAGPGEAQLRAAAIAAAASGQLELRDGAGSEDPWETLVGFRLDGPAPVRWEIEPLGGGEPLIVSIAGDRVSVDDGELRPLRIARTADGVALELDGATTTTFELADAGPARWVASGADSLAFALAEPVVMGADAAAAGSLEAPMPGTVLSVAVREGDTVSAGQTLVVLESMKMEMSLAAAADGVVAAVHVAAGDGVRQGEPLVEIGDPE